MTTRERASHQFNHIRASGALSIRSGNQKTQSASNHQISFDFKPIKVIGKGAFGVVYSARSPSGEIVAIKKVLQDPHYKNRELDILKMLQNENCISAKQAFKTRGQKNEIYLNIVMDFLPVTVYHFLMAYRDQRMYPPLIYVKLFGFQLFSGLRYLHSQKICHRDIKPQNILVDPATGELKICDFGSAKILKPGEKSVSYIASRFYRAPELVFDCPSYTTAIDIWAAGCVFVELLNSGTPLFQGQTSLGQLHEIIKTIGPPTESDLRSFPHALNPNIAVNASTSLEALIPKHTPKEMIDLLKKIFVYNPSKRPSALQCMQHCCFDELFERGRILPNKSPMPKLDRNPCY